MPETSVTSFIHHSFTPSWLIQPALMEHRLGPGRGGRWVLTQLSFLHGLSLLPVGSPLPKKKKREDQAIWDERPVISIRGRLHSPHHGANSIYLILLIVLEWDPLRLYFTDGETKAQRGQVNFPQSTQLVSGGGGI